MNPRKIVWLVVLVVFSGCSTPQEVAQVEPTWTLAQLVSLTPRVTATPVMSRTPLPTATLTPSETSIPPTASDTLTPTEVPPVIGIVQSLNSVNVREGPGTAFTTIAVLDPGTGVTVIEPDDTGDWLMIEMEDGDVGWISAPLLRVQPTATLPPTFTQTPDLTALALGTPLPTAVLGGGTVTATPPRSVVTLTPVGGEDDATEEAEDTEESADPSATSGSVLSITGTASVPVIDTTSISLTLTARAGGLNLTTPTAPAQSGSSTPVAVTTNQLTPAATTSGGGGTATSGVDVLAYCDNNAFGSPPPRNLAAGSTIDVFWGWFARTRAQVEDHIEHAVYDVRVNGVPLEDWEAYRGTIRQESDGNYHVYWYVPSEALDSGPVEITYEVTWENEITDGYASFGPGTANESETGTCNFTVQ
jgi:SH3-like domain-containing protein